MYYEIPNDCPNCGEPARIVKVGVNAEWKMAVNLACPKCNRNAGIEYEIANIVANCREQDGTLLT